MMIFCIRHGENIHFDPTGYRFIQWRTVRESLGTALSEQCVRLFRREFSFTNVGRKMGARSLVSARAGRACCAGLCVQAHQGAEIPNTALKAGKITGPFSPPMAAHDDNKPAGITTFAKISVCAFLGGHFGYFALVRFRNRTRPRCAIEYSC
jgi:hypothetical protein